MSEVLRIAGAATWTAQRERPAAVLLTPRMRGRASLLTGMFANVVESASSEACVDARELPMIFASAYGEMGTMRSLLEQLHTTGVLSPAKFQASVHNTANMGWFSSDRAVAEYAEEIWQVPFRFPGTDA